MPPFGHQHRPFGLDKTVAVIGAGISGICAAAHLLKQGLRVTVYERSGVAGGVWHYDERVSDDVPYPNTTPSRGDYRVSERGEFACATETPNHLGNAHGGVNIGGSEGVPIREVEFAPPGPCYAGLKNNVPTSVMASSLDSWPKGTEAHVSQRLVEQYIQGLSKKFGVDAVTLYHTRVDEARKTMDGLKWEIRSVTLEKLGTGARLVEKVAQFDLLVVASGHYNMPRVPDIEGLKDWKAAYPDRVTHSKRYRTPEMYRHRNVLVIGGGVSALDICRELDGVAKKTYQSVRGGQFDLSETLLPPSAVRVAEVERFVLRKEPSHGNGHDGLEKEEPVAGSVILKDGRVLDDIDYVVLATGYITSYPFLSQLHSDTAAITEAGEELIVTSDGDMAHNLHWDIFYINDPTLAFVGVPYHVATFSLFDFQAQAVARVFAGRTRLPSREEMRREYKKRVQEKGLGRAFHSLWAPGHEITYVQELVDWVNRCGLETGEEITDPMQPHSEEWRREYGELKAKLLGVRGSLLGPTVVGKHLESES
jgi:cation diffusion facilitator CzcD-associated flavoprotein CzcO